VVGTMWATADIDGQVLAKHFYASVFFRQMVNACHVMRELAGALRDAVQVLRRKKKCDHGGPGALGEFGSFRA
jgi:hypothetical protein